jgi:hypothetical protein
MLPVAQYTLRQRRSDRHRPTQITKQTKKQYYYSFQLKTHTSCSLKCILYKSPGVSESHTHKHTHTHLTPSMPWKCIRATSSEIIRLEWLMFTGCAICCSPNARFEPRPVRCNLPRLSPKYCGFLLYVALHQ